MKYNVGDYLVHEGSGVCRIMDIDDMELMGKGSKKTYYIMEPVYKVGAKVFTPIDGSSLKLRDVAGADDFEMILAKIDSIAIIEEPNDRVRQELFKAKMGEFTIEAFASVVKTVLIRKWDRIAAGKKVMASDEKVLALAGRKFYEEMAFSMKLSVDEVQEIFEERVRKCFSPSTVLA